jgi:hypothetical protein
VCDAHTHVAHVLSWYKNDAPLERNRRYRVSARDQQSVLRITQLEVLDTAYYKCNATNAAGWRATEGVLSVRAVNVQRPRPIPAPIDVNSLDDGFDDDMDDELLPAAHTTAAPAIGASGARLPTGVNDRWMLDPVSNRPAKNTCRIYAGEACHSILSGRSVLIESTIAEHIRDNGVCVIYVRHTAHAHLQIDTSLPPPPQLAAIRWCHANVPTIHTT